jgi:hypothetical protein
MTSMGMELPQHGETHISGGSDPILGMAGTLNVIINGNGAIISTGVKLDVVIDFACTIKSATTLADQTGDIVVNIWKDTYANFPPTVADKITASAPPTISGGTKAQDMTLMGWTTAIAAGDVLRFNVDSCSAIRRATVAMKLERV